MAQMTVAQWCEAVEQASHGRLNEAGHNHSALPSTYGGADTQPCRPPTARQRDSKSQVERDMIVKRCWKKGPAGTLEDLPQSFKAVPPDLAFQGINQSKEVTS